MFKFFQQKKPYFSSRVKKKNTLTLIKFKKFDSSK